MNRVKIISSLLGLFVLFLMTYFYFFKTGEPRFIIAKANYRELATWNDDEQSYALQAFKNSCLEILKRDAAANFSSLPESGKVSDWQTICVAANQINAADANSARQFFEQWFDLYEVKTQISPQGLFTGYYLPLLRASLTPSEEFHFPIYGLPKDLVKVPLELFRPWLSGKSLIGYVNQNRLLPYPDRAAIAKGAIENEAPVIAWGDSDIDIFFAQIQGSAVLQLHDQSKVTMGYAGDNGRSYVAIGKVLLDKKELDKKNISMQSIKEWLIKHPEQREEIFNTNASYVFFKILPSNDPVGSESIPLTAMRSLAVDTRYIPLGVPVWLETTVPHPLRTSIPFNHLLIAQDTGGAIKGIVRGDLYCGAGDDAAFIAGNMQNKGQYWVLLPKPRVGRSA